jgi:hypothetical protein
MAVVEDIDYIRRYKGLTEKIKLIEVIAKRNVFCFKIISASDSLYNIIVQNYTDEIIIECTCNDYCKRDKICKHLCWFGLKIIGVDEKYMIRWQQSKMIHNLYEIEKKLDDFLINYHIPYIFTTMGKNDVCFICLDNINYKNECVVCCETGCENAIHAKCWNRYQLYNNTNRCIICRQYTIV